MFRLQDTVRRVKNLFKINNLYDCARPILVLLGLAGVGGTRLRNTEGVYSLHNTRYTTFITVIMSVIYASCWLIYHFYNIFLKDMEYALSIRIYFIIGFCSGFLEMFTISAGGIMSHVSCKRLERVLQIIHNVDRQLEEANIRVQHWQITLKVAVIALVNMKSMLTTVTTIHIVEERSAHDNYILRRVSLARHVHEQLTEVVQLLSDSCRYVVMGVLAGFTLKILVNVFGVFVYQFSGIYDAFTAALSIVLLTFICQANKNERRVRTARIRQLLAFETNREIVQQLQQYTMYNAFSTPGPIDLQFSDINNVLLFAIIDVVASNILIIYSYTR